MDDEDISTLWENMKCTLHCNLYFIIKHISKLYKIYTKYSISECYVASITQNIPEELNFHLIAFMNTKILKQLHDA
jgi:hypothetical protein